MGSWGGEWVDYKMPRECASGRFSVLGHQWAGGRSPPPDPQPVPPTFSPSVWCPWPSGGSWCPGSDLVLTISSFPGATG